MAMHRSQVQGRVPILQQRCIPGEMACAEEHPLPAPNTREGIVYLLEAFSFGYSAEYRYYPVLAKAYQCLSFK